MENLMLLASCFVVLSCFVTRNEGFLIGDISKRDILAMYDESEDSVLVQMQRTTSQKRENGFWMLQYKCIGGCEPSQWTDTKPTFERWSRLREIMKMDNGDMDLYDGTVRLRGLLPFHKYGLRTIYSVFPDGSNPRVEPDTRRYPNGREFSV